MHQSIALIKEKVVSLSQLQKNPSRALEGDIIRIVRSGKDIGIFFSKQEFEDLMEEYLPLKPQFKRELERLIKKSKKKTNVPLKRFLA